jgi:hypothetical protein
MKKNVVYEAAKNGPDAIESTLKNERERLILNAINYAQRMKNYDVLDTLVAFVKRDKE